MPITNFKDAKDGRKALCYLVGKKTAVESGSLTVGKLYCITGKAESSSIFGNLNVGDFFYCVSSSKATLGSGDTAEEIEELFLGQATDKTLSMEKGANDVTCDKDESYNYVSDGLVNVSGSVSGFDLGEKSTAGVTELKQRFVKIQKYSDDGTIETLEPKSYEKDILIFKWNMRNITEGEEVEMDIVPCIINSMEHGSSYGSPQSLDINFQGCDSDDEGRKRCNIIAPYHKVVETA